MASGTRAGLIALTEKWGAMRGPSAITPATCRSVIQVLNELPADRVTPKVSPDGDGGILMVWGDRGAPDLVIGIYDAIIYSVVAPGTEHSKHVSEMEFTGTIPTEILGLVPTAEI